MKPLTPLYGIELIDCAQANAKLGLPTATQQCGYGKNIQAFQKELKKACEKMGVKFSSLGDLILEQEKINRGIDFSPDTPNQL